MEPLSLLNWTSVFSFAFFQDCKERADFLFQLHVIVLLIWMDFKTNLHFFNRHRALFPEFMDFLLFECSNCWDILIWSLILSLRLIVKNCIGFFNGTSDSSVSNSVFYQVVEYFTTFFDTIHSLNSILICHFNVKVWCLGWKMFFKNYFFPLV